MKRFHVHVGAEDLDDSIRFYSSLFATAPTVRPTGYAKWILEDPRMNFAISRRGHATGAKHLEFQVESAETLTGMRGPLQAADAWLVEKTGRACCYANADKYWVTDRAGIAWEAFHMLGSIPVFGDDTPVKAKSPSRCTG
jgi:hypothetical protein